MPAVITPPSPPAEARNRLATHLKELEAARRAAETARRPWLHLRDESGAAARAVEEARVALAGVDEKEAADLASWASAPDRKQRPALRAQERAERAKALEATQVALDRIQRARDSLLPAVTAANATLVRLDQKTPSLMLDVVADIAPGLIEQIEQTALAHARAKASVFGCLALLSGQIRDKAGGPMPPTAAFRRAAELAEQIGEAARHAVVHVDATGDELAAAGQRWRAFAEQLVTNPNATLETNP